MTLQELQKTVLIRPKSRADLFGKVYSSNLLTKILQRHRNGLLL